MDLSFGNPVNQTGRLERLDVVVDLLGGAPDPLRELGAGRLFGHVPQHIEPSRLQEHRRLVDVVDVEDVLHALIVQ